MGEDDKLNKNELEELIKEILSGAFCASDHEGCNKDEIRLCLHHLDGANDENFKCERITKLKLKY